MELAPMPKLVMIAGSGKRAKQARIPRTPMPTTDIPITLPPLKAMVSASFIPLVAAKAVFPLVLVATTIPMYPAAALHRPPTMNETPDAVPMVNKRMTPTTIRNGSSHLYSLYRKAMAPL